eukprot:CAMPEP_0179118136 /NCGR_PEP_ID=MMETSP0796-20121207/55534_1 /TAXON_ID=73915 /ORGANISM="Pyrodinium bahamense, Strain pbaha01" /LENGTH=227 /DNA_ID=CAMNT_0020816557 /DNA_START=50 /DNA_END=733 /DNA_ORIENTATION=+
MAATGFWKDLRLVDVPPAAPKDFLVELPAELPPSEPYYFLSARQRVICQRYLELKAYASFLPGWVPHRRVAVALGHGEQGIEAALKSLDGVPYVWGTEFENVHTLWRFEEPSFEVGGKVYHGSESFYQAQKPFPFDAEEWDAKRDGVMRTAVAKKFQDPELRRLLLSTRSHPLLSIKHDKYWGMSPTGEGQNMLARMLMDLREELKVEHGTSTHAGAAELAPCVGDS